MVRRLMLSFALTGLLSVVVALPAAAHIGVSADDPHPGAFSVITFRVPNEEADADTVGLKVQLPVEHPFAFVSVQPKPGWTFTTTSTKLAKPITTDDGTVTEAVTEITWKGGKIAPGEFDEFKIQAGPLPGDATSLTFKAIQTYRDASGADHDVAWIQVAAKGQPEPDHPAPVLALTAGAATASSGGAMTGGPMVTAQTPAATSKPATPSSGTSAVAVIALAIGVAGLVMAILALIIAAAARQKFAAATGGQAADVPKDP